jgi:hypothetical protein
MCWNRFLVHRRAGRVAIGLATEHSCPYCGELLECDSSVIGVERLRISEPRRRLMVLERRLFVAKVDAEVRERERIRKLQEAEERKRRDAL